VHLEADPDARASAYRDGAAAGGPERLTVGVPRLAVLAQPTSIGSVSIKKARIAYESSAVGLG
jgi:hypothetical protein